jgi:hypothetical protein
MTDLPADLSAIDQLLDAGDLDAARAALDSIDDGSDAALVVKIKLGLMDGSLPPGAAMQRLIALMRRNPDAPGAKQLYREASNVAYQGGQSSHSHSHPPPPVTPKDEK